MIQSDPGPTLTQTTWPVYACGTDFAGTNDSTVVVFTDGTGSTYDWTALDDPPQEAEEEEVRYCAPAPWARTLFPAHESPHQNIENRLPLICRSGRRSSATGVRNFRRQQ